MVVDERSVSLVYQTFWKRESEGQLQDEIFKNGTNSANLGHYDMLRIQNQLVRLQYGTWRLAVAKHGFDLYK
jgi:hypothetical protein